MSGKKKMRADLTIKQIKSHKVAYEIVKRHISENPLIKKKISKKQKFI